MHKPRLLFFHSEVRPYRVPLFQLLHKYYDMQFIFLQGTREADRLPGMHGLRYRYLTRVWFPGYSSDVCPGVISLLIGQRHTYDLAVFSGIFSFATHVGMPIAKLMGKKVILWDETWVLPAHPLARIFKPYLRRLIRQADLLVAAGSRTELLYRSLGADPRTIFIAPNAAEDLREAVKSERVVSLRRTLRLPYSAVVIGYLGRIVRYKNLDALIRSFTQIRPRQRNVHLLIVGDGPFAPDCRGLLDQVGWERVHWIDGDPRTIEPVSHDDFIHYLALCDIFVLPGRFIHNDMVPAEAWGLTINEAMSLSKPIISTDSVAAAYDMIESGCNGYRVRAGDDQALTLAIDRLITSGQLRHRFGMRSRKMIDERFNYDAMFTGFRKAIEQTWQR